MFKALSVLFFLTLSNFSFGSSTTFFGGGDTLTSYVHYDLNACEAFINAGTNRDFSEFVGTAVNDPNCARISPMGTLYRTNPDVNGHSCTSGVNGSDAMCVSSDDTCTYDSTSDKAVKIEVMLTPTAAGTASLSGISFYENAPSTYSWNSGGTGPNNPPTLYALRVLKDGVEIFRSESNPTTRDWTLEEFDFSGNADFTVSSNTFFTFELLGYCLEGNGAAVAAWDLDEIRIFSTCANTDIAGGAINIAGGGTTIDICANDGVSDAFDVELSGATGSDNTYLITEEDGTVVAIASGPTFDLEGAGSGICFIWHLTSNGTLNGLAVGSNVNDVTGCFALSNPIVVNRNMQDGGTIEISPGGATEVSICVGDGNADVIDVNLSGTSGTNTAWVITDEDANILELPAGPPFDFEGAGIGVCLIWNVSYEGMLEGAVVGNNASDLQGCFGLSNPIRVERTTATAGSISANGGQTMFEICASDGVEDIIDVEVTGAVGSGEAYLITDTDGNIISIRNDGTIDADRFGNGTCLIWHISYAGNISGLNQGGNANDITGCFGLSNPITVIKRSTTGGVFSTTGNQTFLSICESNGDMETVETRLTGAVGMNLVYIIADMDGNILELTTDDVLDFSAYDRGRYSVYAYSYDSATSGLEVGDNISDIADSCSGLSNPLVIAKGRVSAGTISTPDGDEITACVRGAVTDDIVIDITDLDAPFDRWIITDLSGNIIGLPGRPPFGIEVMGANQTCQIWNVAFDTYFVGLNQGNNVSDFEGCFDISNPITVNKTTSDGGSISLPGGDTSLDLCNDGSGSMSVEVDITDEVGDNMAWVITDGSNNIIAITSPPFDFNQYGDGNYRIWSLSWSGDLTGAEVGNNASDLDGSCFDLSNFISVTSQSVEPGTVTSPMGDEFTICTYDGQSDPLEFNVTGNEGSESRWIVTDENGVIDQLPGSSPFTLDGIPGATCIVYHLSSNGDYEGLNRGRNISELDGCFALSNSITINKNDISAGEIADGNGNTEVTVCVGDGNPDLVDVVLTGGHGDHRYVITDVDGNILDLPTVSPFDFDAVSVGVCLIWNLSYAGDLTGVEVGANASGIEGCFELSNSIRVNRIEVDAGAISSDGETEVEVCLDDPNDVVDVQVTGGATAGNKGWVITDLNGEILALPAGPPFSFTGAGEGTCLIWRICFADGLAGAAVGNNASDLDGCFDLSDPITVNRVTGGDPVESSSSLKFNMDACYADTADESNCDYTEFTAEVANDPACTQYTVLGDHLYRNNPNINKHSCTPGINGTTAMCVSALDNCDFVDDSDSAVRFDIEVAPGTGGVGSISMLSFHESAPPTFNWINGANGINNYPTKYGIRVLKDGVEIYKEDEIFTTNDYTLETFDFSGNADFTVTESTVFSFELLGYCLVGANSTVAAWDLDDIMISSDCLTGGGANGCDATNIVENEEEDEEVIENVEKLSFQIIPNPVEDYMVLKANKNPMEGSKVYVYDRMGRVVDAYTISNKELAFDISEYPEGYYFVKLLSEGKQITESFMKL